MKPRQVEKAKQCVMKVMGVHTGFNWTQPYIEVEEFQAGGTAFFVNPKDLGNFPSSTRCRYLLTNFHVVDSVKSKTVELCYPSKGYNKLNASILHVVPGLDVAILQIDPNEEHPSWRDGGSIHEFLEGIPNLSLNKNAIKGNSQEIIAIGFPSLSADVQLCGGKISGRGLGMIQCNISFNGGNSGGPLMSNNKVIGICTASEAEAEAIGLAVPINQILRFFKYWTTFDTQLVQLPSWGVNLQILTEDYLNYHNINDMQGVLVRKVVKNQSCDTAGLKENDIILGINNSTGRYNIDYDGLVKVEWTNKRVPITNEEFIMSLDPDTIEFVIYQHRTKKRVTLKVQPHVIDFQTREKFHCWEDIEHVTFGGCVFMNLSMNHMEDDEEGEMPIHYSQCVTITNLIKKNMNMDHIVVCTHIPGQTYLDTQRNLLPFDIVKKVNKTTVKNISHFRELIGKLAKNIDNKRYAVLETERTKVYIDLQKIAAQEVVLGLKFPNQAFITNIGRKRKRKRRVLMNMS